MVLLVVTVTVYALVEAFQSDARAIRRMPRWLWVAAIICLPGVGAVCWFLLGRPGPALPGGAPGRPPIAPDDDPDFLRRL
nr:PLDc N-terminal domain-containing protein [Propioniciclava soli]